MDGGVVHAAREPEVRVVSALAGRPGRPVWLAALGCEAVANADWHLDCVVPARLLTVRLTMGRASAIVGNASPDLYVACPHELPTGNAVVPIPAMQHRLTTPGSS